MAEPASGVACSLWLPTSLVRSEEAAATAPV